MSLLKKILRWLKSLFMKIKKDSGFDFSRVKPLNKNKVMIYTPKGYKRPSQRAKERRMRLFKKHQY